MKKLLSLLLISVLLCGCTQDNTEITTTTADTTTSPVTTVAPDTEDNGNKNGGLTFTAPDGKELDLSDESYYTFTLDCVYGYENLGYIGEESPDSETLGKREYKRYNVDENVGSFKVTYAKSEFSVSDGVVSPLVQSLTLSGEGSLKGIVALDEHNSIKFYPYPESLDEAKIPCIFNRDEYSTGDFIPVLQPDGTRKYMNTMEFSVTLGGEALNGYGENGAEEITLKFSILKFSTDGIKGYTYVSAEATEIIK